jgi:hypothetical protein
MLNSASTTLFIRHFIRTNRPDHRSMQDQPKIIAIIDDEPLMLEAIEHLLGTYGLITRVFASAEEFLHGDAGDLTWVSWTKLCERMSLERS